MAEDRADDIGGQFPSDSDDAAPLSPVRDRAQVDYSLLPKKLAKQVTTAQTSQQVANPLIQGVLRTVAADHYMLAYIINGEEAALFVAAKPWHLRQTPFDGQQIIGKQYEYLSGELRKVTDVTSRDWIIEEVSPRYMVGSELMYTMAVNATEVPIAPSRIELNVNGHQWVPAAVKKALVLESLADKLLCYAVDFAGHGYGRPFYIAKQFELRESTWNGLTIDGIHYERTGPDEREASSDDTATELEVIIPYYVTNHTVIYYTPQVPYGADADVVGTDLNLGARAWTLKVDP